MLSMDAFLTASLIGFSLVGCGYLLGRERGVKETLQSMFDTKLLTPEQVLRHYEKLGFRRKD